MSTQEINGHAAGREELDEGLPGAADLLTAEEVAAILRMTKAWVYTQTRADRIPHVSLGRYVRYRRSAVLAWLGEIERGSIGATRW